MNEEDLLRKLAAVETLFAGPGTDGEGAAAAAARERILARLEALRAKEDPVEFRFRLPDPWSRRLFVALARRYGLEPYRYPRQRRTTVMLRAPRAFVDEVFWPEFEQLSGLLETYLADVTDRVIRESVHEDLSEAGQTPGGRIEG